MPNPTLDLYPPPGDVSQPPRWEDIERLSMHYAQARNAIALVDRGDWTREQALISLVYCFAAAFSKQFKAELDASMLEVLGTITQEPCGCATTTYLRQRVGRFACASHQAGD